MQRTPVVLALATTSCLFRAISDDHGSVAILRTAHDAITDFWTSQCFDEIVRGLVATAHWNDEPNEMYPWRACECQPAAQAKRITLNAPGCPHVRERLQLFHCMPASDSGAVE
jgi:hypothetical protein